MSKDILSVIQTNMSTFSKGQKLIAGFILESYDKAAFMTASRLGKTVNVSESTVVRFAAELGYDGYPAMQKALQEMIRSKLTSVQRMEVTSSRMGEDDILEKVLTSDVEMIRATLEQTSRTDFRQAVDAINVARKIYILGVRSSAALASFMAFYFNLVYDNVVLVDTEIVSKAPARLLVSGMGDALATYFEARACQRSNATNCVGGKTTLAAMALARLCYDTLMADGRKAAVAAKAGACTKALENIVEANTYLSGIGFESGGLAGAHAIHNGLTAIPETHAFYHGEKVAFGTLVQLVLEDEHFEQIQEVVRFCTDVGLPTTLADLGIAEIKPEQIHAVAELACAPSDTLGNMPFAVTPDAVYDAILGADAIGRKYKELHA